jgi:imidazolonepropionase-like amidohydrolase
MRKYWVCFDIEAIKRSIYVISYFRVSNLCSLLKTIPKLIPFSKLFAMERFIKPWLPSPDELSYTFIHASVIDVEKGSILSDATVRISNGCFQSIQPEASTPKSEVGHVIDLEGKYLMPGLIDSHVHISATPGESDPHKMFRPEQIMTAFRITYVCQQILSRGFTTVRDCGGAPIALKSAIQEWLVPGPRLLLAGHALTQNGGHGDFREPHEHNDPECPTCGHFVGLARTVNGVAEALHKTRDELRQGADFIKVMGSGGMLGDGKITIEHTQFTPEEMEAITSVANAASTYATVHAYTPESIQHAINNGAKGIEHGNMLDRPTAKLMAEKGVFLTPTLVTFAIGADGPGSSMLSLAKREKYRSALATGLEALQIAKEENVKICFGTDLLGPVGVFQSREFAIRAQVQSPLEIIQSATIAPASMMGLEGVGQIKEGFLADFLVLKSNPLEDITVLERVQSELLAVFKEGRACYSTLPGVQGLLI